MNPRSDDVFAPVASSKLRRSLTLTHAVLYGLGITIGAGIYVLVGLAAGRAGVHAPLAFILAALMMSFSAATFAELGTRMPVAASEAAYVGAAFRRRWIVLAVGFLSVATSTISAATISAGSAGYLSVFIDLPRPVLIAGIIIAMGLVASLATVNSVSFAGAMTLVEIGGLLLIIGFGLTRPEVITRLPEMIPLQLGPAQWIGIGATALLAVFAFIGFEHLVNVSEEMIAPNHTLPRALFITLGLTTLLYVLVVWVSVIVVPPAELAASPAPLALVFTRLTGWPITLMSAIAVVATLNGIIVNIIIIARVLFGMAEQGHLSAALTHVHARTQAPIAATAAAVSAILVMALSVPMVGLADLAATGTLIIFSIVNLALIRIKARKAKVPAGVFVAPSWVPYAGLACTLLLLGVDILAR